MTININNNEYIDGLIARIQYLEKLNDSLRKEIRSLKRKNINRDYTSNYYHGMIETDQDR